MHTGEVSDEGINWIQFGRDCKDSCVFKEKDYFPLKNSLVLGKLKLSISALIRSMNVSCYSPNCVSIKCYLD